MSGIISGIRQLLYHSYTEFEIKNHDLKYLFLEITRRCNLSCVHCGSDCSSAVSGEELTTESWLKIIDYIASVYSPLPVMVITGGEPLVHPDLFRITEALGEKGFPWGMVTNGYTLDEKTLNKLISHKIASITLSFDGDRESIGHIRNRADACPRILNSLNLTGSSEIPVRDAVTCVYPGNLGKLEYTSDLLAEKGMTSHRLFRIFPKGRAAENQNLYLNRTDSLKIVQWIKENRKKYQKQGLNLSFSCEGYLPFAGDLKVRDEPFFCRAGITFGSILANGSITGCSNNGPEFYQGNILADNFSRIWQDRFLPYRDRSWMKTGICEACPEWKYCRGGSIHLRTEGKEDPDFCYLRE